MENQNHNHNRCKHENLKWCEICNIVYCNNSDCKEEWKKNIINWDYILHAPYIPYTPYTWIEGAVESNNHMHKAN